MTPRKKLSGLAEPMQINPLGGVAGACSRSVDIGVEGANPSKTSSARWQMRTSEERTSGAWTDGCVITTDGRYGKTALQATGNTATPKNTQGA